MIVILCSEQDIASLTIRGSLLSSLNWKDSGLKIDDREILLWNNSILVTISDLHLLRETIVEDLRSAGIEPRGIIVASKHTSASGKKCLTVHPTGNYENADYGGRPSSLSVAFPHAMTHALRLLKTHASGLDTSISFEATHHGPLIDIPSFFIEIGSSHNEWTDKRYADVIADVVVRILEKGYPADDPVAIGVGGGHYVPRITDVALTKKVSFGHIVPSYIADGEEWKNAIHLAISRTPGVSHAYIDRKSLRKSRVREVESFLHEKGIETRRSEGFNSI